MTGPFGSCSDYTADVTAVVLASIPDTGEIQCQTEGGGAGGGAHVTCNIKIYTGVSCFQELDAIL